MTLSVTGDVAQTTDRLVDRAKTQIVRLRAAITPGWKGWRR